MFFFFLKIFIYLREERGKENTYKQAQEGVGSGGEEGEGEQTTC